MIAHLSSSYFRATSFLEQSSSKLHYILVYCLIFSLFGWNMNLMTPIPHRDLAQDFSG